MSDNANAAPNIGADAVAMRAAPDFGNISPVAQPPPNDPLTVQGRAYLLEILDDANNKSPDALLSSDQVCMCNDEDALDFIARAWADPDVDERSEASIERIVSKWGHRQLMAVSCKLGLQQYKRADGYMNLYRASIVSKVRAHADAHPELFARALRVSSSVSRTAAVNVPQNVPALAPRRSSRLQDPSSAFRYAEALPIVEEKRGPPPRTRGRKKHSHHGRSPTSHQPISDDEDVYTDESPGDESSDYDEPDEIFESSYLPSSSRESGELSTSALRRQLSAMGQIEPVAAAFLRNANRAAGGGTLYNLYKSSIIPKFPENGAEAAKKECLAWARLLDCLQAKDIKGAFEVACRRLGGVQMGAQSGNWRMCAELDRDVQSDSFLPHSIVSAALKAVTRDANIRKMARDESSTKSWSGKRKTFKGKARGAEKGTGSSEKNRGKRDDSASSGPERK